ncbi:MAG: hypothetical protein RBU30_05375 [Polyangia bacterium]|jgi:DNA-binding NtrC family response regulator|nr:hypothetical protein [Polyangia bacterium]
MQHASILLYHADPVEARVLTGMLRAVGYRVLATDSLNEARLLLVTLPVDVLIVDWPQEASAPPTLLSQVSQRCPAVLRLMLVDREQSGPALRALRVGLVHGLVYKPVRSTDLVAAVELAVKDPEALQPADRAEEAEEEPPAAGSARCASGN